MTNEEAIRFINNISIYCGANIQKALDMAVKALEQEPKSEWEQDHEILKAYSDGANGVIDKIRAEIMQLDYDTESVDYDYNDMTQTEEVHTIYREEVLQILDKYKAESEG